MVLIDTCAIIELCKEKPTLSAKTLKTLDKGAYILAISFAELACLVKAERLEINMPLEELYLEYTQVPQIEIVKIGVEEWLDSVNLDWSANKDPVDRLLVAYALKKNIAIVTTDKAIKKFYKDVIW